MLSKKKKGGGFFFFLKAQQPLRTPSDTEYCFKKQPRSLPYKVLLRRNRTRGGWGGGKKKTTLCEMRSRRDEHKDLFPEIKCLKPNCLGGRDGKVSVFPCYFHIFPDQITRKKLEQVNIVI